MVDYNNVGIKDLGYTLEEYTQKWVNNPNNPNYWLDSHDATPNGDGTYTMIVVPVKMPYKYIIEMFCDFVGAGKAYDKGEWTVKTPWNYWNNNCEGKRAMHKDSYDLIKLLLKTLSESESLNIFLDWYEENKDQLEADYNSK